MNIRKTFKEIKKLDDITQFRLFNAFIFAIGINMLVPVLMDLKGEYLAAWVISLFLIGEQLIAKTNRWFTTNFSISQIYKLGIITHLVFLISAGLYFWSPLYMIIAESTLAILSVGIYGVYSIKLNVFLANKYPENMQEFQILRNNIWADGLLIGLLAATIITFLLSNGAAVAAFIVWNSLYILWMLNNWNFYNPFIKNGDIK